VPVLGYAPALALSQILQDGLGRSPRELHLHTVTESDFAESLHEQALQGVGLAWLPRGLVGNDLQGRPAGGGRPQRHGDTLRDPAVPPAQRAQRAGAAHLGGQPGGVTVRMGVCVLRIRRCTGDF
jgi:DNA-binding transcriptional LysR family regulator